MAVILVFQCYISIFKLSERINEPRLRQNQITEKTFIRYVNHSISNKRFYQSGKNIPNKKKATKTKDVIQKGKKNEDEEVVEDDDDEHDNDADKAYKPK